MSLLRVGSISAALLVAAAASVHAQSTGTICGTTTDSAGAALPGVAVTLVHSLGCESASTCHSEAIDKATTDAAGKHLFPKVPVGSYSLNFRLDGFTTLERLGVKITAAFEALVEARMWTLSESQNRPVAPVRNTFDNRVLPAHRCSAPR